MSIDRTLLFNLATSRRLERAILRAALLELADAGYAGFSMESVAARAETGKASLYRRWPDRDHLILDSVRGGIPAGPGQPAYSGDLRADLLALYTGTARGLATPIGGAFRAVLSETHRRPELLAALHETVFDPAARGLRSLLRAAAEAGEIDPAVVDREIVTVGHEHLVFIFMTSGRVTHEQILRIVDDLMAPILALCADSQRFRETPAQKRDATRH